VPRVVQDPAEVPDGFGAFWLVVVLRVDSLAADFDLIGGLGGFG